MASAFARSGGRVIASAAAVLSSHFPSSINQQADNNSNDLEPGAIQNPPFRQLSSKEVDDVARTIFVGKNESNHNNNNNPTTNNPNPTSSASSTSSSIQVHHHSLNPLALALGQQLAEDPKIQQSLYEHMREKWSMIAKGGTGVEKEINLSDAEEEEWSVNSPIISDIEGDDWSHLSRNQLVLSPELFAMAHQALPSHASNDAEGMPSHNHHHHNDADHHHHQQQQHSSSSSTSTDSKSNHHHPNNPHPENKTEEEVGIFDRFVRWVGSLFTPQQQPSEEGIAQQNHPHQSSPSNAPPAAAPTSTPSRLKSLLGNIEIYQMALAVAAVIVFVAIFRRPPPRF